MRKLSVIFGGMSTENEVSVKSGMSVLKNLDKNKYDIYPIYIDKNGSWYEYNEMKEIENVVKFLKNMDVIFPVLHGLYGEDGTIQGLLELIEVPYIGCKVLASSIGMDKAYTKIIFEKAKIKQAKYLYIKNYYNDEFIYVDENFNENIFKINEIIDLVNKKLKYPVFVKPSNSGSSVGVNKASNNEECERYIKEAIKFDKKILIEEGIIGKEVECAVIGNSKIGIEVSRVGRILSAEDFYSFGAKYENKKSKTKIPADILPKQEEEIRSLSVKAFKAIDGDGLSRVDFFVEDGTNNIYINEINTMPGFTNISMYPKLMEDFGYNYSDLLDKLIESALNN